MRDAHDALPLTPLTMAILVVLAGGERHGYAIRQELASRGAGGIPLGTSSLYAALRRLADDGLIVEVEDESGDDRRRAYGLTELGREAARAEALRLARVVEQARSHRLVTGSELAGEGGWR